MPKNNDDNSLLKLANSLPISEFWGWVDEWISHEDITFLVSRWKKERVEEEERYLNDKINANKKRQSKGDDRR